MSLKPTTGLGSARMASKSFGVPASQVTPAGEGVPGDFGDKTPPFEDPHGFLDPLWSRVARW
jgi:hypothetical protein